MTKHISCDATESTYITGVTSELLLLRALFYVHATDAVLFGSPPPLNLPRTLSPELGDAICQRRGSQASIFFSPRR